MTSQQTIPGSADSAADRELHPSLRDVIRLACGAEANERLADRHLDVVAESIRAHVHALTRAPVTDGQDAWVYLRVPCRPEGYIFTLGQVVVPTMWKAAQAHAINGWWCLNKRDQRGPAIRLRLSCPPEEVAGVEGGVGQLLAQHGCTPSVLTYEPEIQIFGGASGMRVAHAMFCADSRFLCRWLAAGLAGTRHIVPPGLSLALVISMIDAAGCDPFEMWDVFSRVYTHRLLPRQHEARVQSAEELARRVIEKGPRRIIDECGPQRASLAHSCCDALREGAHALNRAYFGGELTCGIREFLTPLILFHWNRIGLSGVAQNSLCRGAIAVLQEQARRTGAGRAVQGV